MPTELSVHAIHQGNMRITASNGTYSLPMDYPLKAGEPVAGLKPLEVLLAALAGCAGNSLAILLKKLGQPYTGLEVRVKGTRREEHPTVFTQIALEFLVRGKNVDPAKVEKAIKQSEELICPVWTMLKPGVKIISSFTIVGE